MRFILSFMKDYKKESILAPLFKMAEAILDLFVPLLVAAIIDRGIYGQNRPFIIEMSFVMFALAAAGLAFSVIAQYFAAKSAVGVAGDMRKTVFSHVLSFGSKEMDDIGTSTLITRLTSDINQVQNGINMVLRLFLRSPFIVVGSMIMAFTIDIRAALIFAVTIPLLAVVVFLIMVVTRPLYKKVQAGLDRILRITRENLSGVRVIRAFRREDREKEIFFKANSELTAMQKLAGRISALTNPLTLLIINFAVLVLIQTGAFRVNNGSLTQGQLVALYNYMAQVSVELIKFANLIVTVTKAWACVNRIQDIHDKKPEMREGERTEIETGGKTAEDSAKESAGTAAVEFQHVSFAYANGGEAVSDITFRAAPGETVGIIGGTGSGKTTLVNLIPRCYDATGGQVCLFGHPVEEYTFDTLKRNISVVPQKAQLFSGTIRSNLTLGCPDATEEEIYKALSISQALDIVEGKEGRLDAPVEQGGKNLSGGQRQRLTLARAILRKTPILILDDSSSALDYATDARLRSALKHMDYKPTIFIVSQRASSLRHADKILVLDDGRIAGCGTSEELLASCRIYREIYETQFQMEG